MIEAIFSNLISSAIISIIKAKHSPKEIVSIDLLQKDNYQLIEKANRFIISNKDKVLYAQLNALLFSNSKLFNEQKLLYGTNGINRNVISEIARLESEIEILLN